MILKSRRVVLPDGERPAAITVENGRITAISPYGTDGDDVGFALLPGLVDTHVHINEPGRTDWEGFETATAAAAAGGITTLIDMPLNSIPPTTTLAGLEAKRARASGRCHVDVGFWGGAIPDNLTDLAPLLAAGVFGFKAFLSESGVLEFPHITLDELRAAVARVDAQFIIHAEDPLGLTAAPSSRHYADFLASRPMRAEDSAIAAVIGVARERGARLHILHLSSAQSLAQIAAARRDGVRITAETCPHYLSLAAGEIPDGATTFKCCPPIREKSNQDALWAGLADGTIDCIVSDHSPSPPAMKHQETGDFGSAWGGISSLQLGLPVIWTEARKRGLSLSHVVRWMASGPADLMGVPGKGRIAPGYAADLVAFDPDESWTVDPARLWHRHPITPYAGRHLSGAVKQVWLAGVPLDGTPRGKLLTREA